MGHNFLFVFLSYKVCICRLISKKCQKGKNSSRLDHYLKKKICCFDILDKFFFVKVFVITVKNSFRFKTRNIRLHKRWYELTAITKSYLSLKDIGLLERRRSILDLLFLVKHLFLLAIFVKLKFSQNSSNFP